MTALQNPERARQHARYVEAKQRMEGHDQARVNELKQQVTELQKAVQDRDETIARMAERINALLKRNAELAREADPAPDDGRIKPTCRMIAAETAKILELSVIDFVGQRRHSSTARARHVAMNVCKELTEASLPNIGKAFGNRDHTTVLHGIRVAARGLEKGDEDIIALRDQIISAVYQRIEEAEAKRGGV